MMKAPAKLEGDYVVIADRKIPIGGPLPKLREEEKLINYTQSICPVCYRLLPAVVFERDGKVWIRKQCPDHGEVEEVYWEDSELYRKALKWWCDGKGTTSYVELEAPCPFNCGLCPRHKSHTVLANIVVTNRCDLSCWYCFFYAEKMGFVYEPSLEQIRFMVRQLAKQGKTMAVQLTGGEPLLRDDLVDIVKMLREEGVRHIQLNTNGLRFVSRPDGVELAKKLRDAGVNTVYLSFDGVSPQTNPKNHWEVPYIFEIFRKASMTSVVLVPTVIRSVNDHELGDIIKFAAANMDIVRGVNFQPVSLVGQMKKHEREKYRITIPGAIKRIEEQTDGQIPKEAWYPVPSAARFSMLIEAATGNVPVMMTNHPACGMATYVYVERDENGLPKRFVPVTEFVDVDGLLEYLEEQATELYTGSSKLMVYAKLLFGLRKFIDQEKAPKEFNFWKLLYNALVKRSYEALGELHYKMLFLGMMHFQDPYNYDVQRAMRCNIHYLLPDGRLVPFCAFNVLPELYRDYVQREYSMSLEEWAKKMGEHTIGDAIKYKRDVKKLESGEVYHKAYDWLLKSRP